MNKITGKKAHDPAGAPPENDKSDIEKTQRNMKVFLKAAEEMRKQFAKMDRELVEAEKDLKKAQSDLEKIKGSRLNLRPRHGEAYFSSREPVGGLSRSKNVR